MKVLEVKNLVKKFGNFTALDGVNLEINKGEIYGFIGPNGAGKSTTIRILLGILKASSGSAQIFGQDTWDDAVELHKRIAYVPGDVNLWPNLTGGEVIDLFTSLRQLKETKRAELIEKFKLDPSKKCRTYSKGNRQKVALIAAFCAEADFYIFDEPTSGLDPLMEKVFQDEVLELKREGKSVLLSSHILAEVEKLCDKISIIRDGKIIDTGTLSELRHLLRTNIKVTTEKQIMNLDKLEGVHDLRMEGNNLYFSIDNLHLPSIMNKLSENGIVYLESTAPSLEELFMSHYNQETKR